MLGLGLNVLRQFAVRRLERKLEVHPATDSNVQRAVLDSLGEFDSVLRDAYVL